MIIYHATKKQFLKDVFDDTIADNIDNAFFAHLGRHTSPNEMRSWKNSMQYMYRVMDTKQLPDDAGVAIEYQIPLTSKRIDFIVGGNDEYGRGNIVIIELKQWEKAEKVDDEMHYSVRTFVAGDNRIVCHPSYQAFSYSRFLVNYSQEIQDRNISLVPCAYLHNYRPDFKSDLSDEIYKEWVTAAPFFVRNEVEKFSAFVNKFVTRKSSSGDLLYLIENGRIRPTKSLQDALTSMVMGNPEFVLLDEQAVCYSPY